jgi:hypothetical protein
MSIPALRYFYPDNDQTQRLYQNLTDWADNVTADTILGGKVVTGVRFIVAGNIAWAAKTFYSLGAVRGNSGNSYTCVQDGTSAVSGAGPTGTTAAIVDGSVKWDFVAAEKQSDVSVAHGLGTTPTGYEVVRLSPLLSASDTDGGAGPATIYDSPNTNKIPDKVILLRATAPTLAALRFF